jgi:hypothetical protein
VRPDGARGARCGPVWKGAGERVIPVLDGALSNTAATGLILGGGALGSGLFVLGLTMLALRRNAREEARERHRLQQVRATARSRASRSAGTAVDELGTHDPYPPQPYSPQEPGSHQPYSRPYKLPRQESHGKTNGHRPPGSNFPTAPYGGPEDEG